MNCSNCGIFNSPESKFCVKCGNVLTTFDNTQINNTTNNQTQINQTVDMQQQYQQSIQTNGIQQSVEIQQTLNVDATPLNYLTYIINILSKPIRCFKSEENKLNNTKISFMLTLIVTAIMTLSNLIQTIITTVRVESYNWIAGYTYSWEWENLKNIKWLEVIGKNFLINAVIIFAIAAIFYIASLIVKKNLDFIKTLSIAATSVIPAIIGAMILSPILGIIWSPLSIVFMIIGLVYSLIILYELINKELNLESDMKVYFNLICFGTLIIAGYYTYMKLFMSVATGGLNNILDMFN